MPTHLKMNEGEKALTRKIITLTILQLTSTKDRSEARTPTNTRGVVEVLAPARGESIGHTSKLLKSTVSMTSLKPGIKKISLHKEDNLSAA